jgi:DNA processing protein
MGAITTHSSAELIGPLGDLERRYAPAELHVAGDTSLLRSGVRIAIVGSRKASALGLERARILATSLAQQGAVVVSGLAEGIDTAAHRAAITAGGRTIAVLGTPLDRTFPLANRDLQLAVMREHLAVSQFAVGTPTLPKHFAMRNRTMALLSDATIVVEAGESSGARYAARESLRLGRAVFVLESLARAGVEWVDDVVRDGAKTLAREDLVGLVERIQQARSTRVGRCASQRGSTAASMVVRDLATSPDITT